MLDRRTFCAAALGAPLLSAQDQKPSPIKIDDLKKLVEEGKNVFDLDVREPKELEELGTLKGYVNIPLGQLESRLNEVPKNRVIVTY